jgi:hypothetical protein
VKLQISLSKAIPALHIVRLMYFKNIFEIRYQLGEEMILHPAGVGGI